MKKIIIAIFILSFANLKSQNNDTDNKKYAENYLNYASVLMYMNGKYCVEDLNTYEFKNSEEGKYLTIKLYYENKLNDGYCLYRESELHDSLRNYNMTYRNNKLYLTNNVWLNRKDFNASDDWLVTYNAEGKISKMENRNFHVYDKQFNMKEKYEFTYVNNNIMGFTQTAIAASAGKNFIDPKIQGTTVALETRYLEKTPSKVVYTYRTWHYTGKRMGKINSIGTQSTEYIGSKIISQTTDSISNGYLKTVSEFNADSTLKKFTHYSQNRAENRSLTEEIECTYMDKKILASEIRTNFANDLLITKTYIDIIKAESKTYDANKKLIKEVANKKARWIIPETGQWTDWQEEVLCPIK